MRKKVKYRALSIIGLEPDLVTDSPSRRRRLSRRAMIWMNLASKTPLFPADTFVKGQIVEVVDQHHKYFGCRGTVMVSAKNNSTRVSVFLENIAKVRSLELDVLEVPQGMRERLARAKEASQFENYLAEKDWFGMPIIEKMNRSQRAAARKRYKKLRREVRKGQKFAERMRDEKRAEREKLEERRERELEMAGSGGEDDHEKKEEEAVLSSSASLQRLREQLSAKQDELFDLQNGMDLSTGEALEGFVPHPIASWESRFACKIGTWSDPPGNGDATL